MEVSDDWLCSSLTMSYCSYTGDGASDVQSVGTMYGLPSCSI